MQGDGKSWFKLYLFYKRMCEDIKGRRLTKRELKIAREIFLSPSSFDDLELYLNKRRFTHRFRNKRRWVK